VRQYPTLYGGRADRAPGSPAHTVRPFGWRPPLRANSRLNRAHVASPFQQEQNSAAVKATSGGNPARRKTAGPSRFLHLRPSSASRSSFPICADANLCQGVREGRPSQDVEERRLARGNDSARASSVPRPRRGDEGLFLNYGRNKKDAWIAKEHELEVAIRERLGGHLESGHRFDTSKPAACAVQRGAELDDVPVFSRLSHSANLSVLPHPRYN
jgi:hypothetical protein